MRPRKKTKTKGGEEEGEEGEEWGEGEEGEEEEEEEEGGAHRHITEEDLRLGLPAEVALRADFEAQLAALAALWDGQEEHLGDYRISKFKEQETAMNQFRASYSPLTPHH